MGKYWVLWGWRSDGAYGAEPIMLNVGSHTMCRRGQAIREREKSGWLLAIYRNGVAPEGLRAQVRAAMAL